MKKKMEISFEEKRRILDEKRAKLDIEVEALEAEEKMREEITALLPVELREEHEREGESVKEARAYLDEAKSAFGVAREKQKSVERRIADILNGEQLKVYLGGSTKAAASVGGVGRGKQGKRILELLAEGNGKRTDMVVVLKEEFNGADCHGAFDRLKKNGVISIADGIVELV